MLMLVPSRSLGGIAKQFCSRCLGFKKLLLQRLLGSIPAAAAAAGSAVRITSAMQLHACSSAKGRRMI
jgi:hypothetical protein